ncbi:MDR family MFS transporter [Streptomyces sp. NPDC052396]|uniref:MDR family MFS transporter n=1 Tax=Streptomyces sp. NPDC052396 TaxID=3365689 RepID=UPI0037CE5D13
MIARVGRAARESISGLPREFWWLWTSTLVNRLGAFVSTFLALYLTQERGFSASYAGLVAALYGLGGVIASVGAGVLADRLGRRPTLFLAQLSTSFTVAALGFVQQPAAIAAVAFLVGLTSNSSRPAVQAILADVVRPEDRMRAFALNYWALNLGWAFASVAAGFLAEISYRIGFATESVMLLLCAALCFFRIPETRPDRTAGDTAEDQQAVSLGTVLRDGRFMGVTGLAFLIALLFNQMSMALPVTMGRDGLSSGDYGTVVAVNGFLIVALQIPVTRFIEHRSPQRLLTVSALLAGYGFGLTAVAGSIPFYMLTVGIWTLGEIINSPTQTGLVARLSPTHGRGRYQGVFSLSWTLAGLVSPLAGGAVIDHFGPDTLWAGCAVLGTVAAAGYTLLMRELPPGNDRITPAPKAAAEPDPASV